MIEINEPELMAQRKALRLLALTVAFGVATFMGKPNFSRCRETVMFLLSHLCDIDISQAFQRSVGKPCAA